LTLSYSDGITFHGGLKHWNLQTVDCVSVDCVCLSGLDMKSLFHVTCSVPLAVGHLPLLARLSGTLCPRTCGIRMFLRTVSGSHWRRFYFRST